MKLYQFFDQDSPEYVILHAQARAKRGKRPSMSFRGINNPREALLSANVALYEKRTWTVLSPRVKALTGDIIVRIAKALNLRFATIEELERLFDRPEQIAPRTRVPFVEVCNDRIEFDWVSDRNDTWGARSGVVFMAFLT